MSQSIKVLIAEDHDVVRQGLKILISSDPTIQITGEARDGQNAVRLAAKLRPDVVLLDLAMPKSNGLEAARDICRNLPSARVLILTAYQDEETVQRVLEAGVSGYLTKHSAADELLTAIHEVSQGRAYYSAKIAAKLRLRQRHSFAAASDAARTAPRLTPREEEVLVLIARGHPNKEIAFTLNLSIKTVEKHRQAAMDKLGIHDIAGLTRYAIEKGLVAVPAAQTVLPFMRDSNAPAT